MNNIKALERKLAFVSFCLEEYKTLRGLDGSKAAFCFEKYGIVDYLMEHYDILHSFGRDAILNDIEQFIRNQGGRQ